MEQSPVKKTYFKNLDPLRFFAAFSVMIAHCLKFDQTTLNENRWLFGPFKILINGELRVPFFFVLSGFLIGYIVFYEKSIDRFSLKKFLIRRALRIWPLFYAVLFITFIVFPVLVGLKSSNYHFYPSFLNYLLFAGNFVTLDIFKYNNFSLASHPALVTWSIAIEEQFYIVLALITMMIEKRFIKFLFLALSFVGFLFVINVDPNNIYMHVHTLWYAFDFFLAAFFGSLVAEKQQFSLWLFNKRRIIEAILGSSLVVIVLFYKSPSAYNWVKLATSSFLMLLVLYAAYGQNKFFEKLGNNNSLAYLSKISYGIFLLHSFCQYPFYRFAESNLSSFSVFQKSLFVLLFTAISTIFIAHLSYKYYESFFLRLKKKFY